MVEYRKAGVRVIRNETGHTPPGAHWLQRELVTAKGCKQILILVDDKEPRKGNQQFVTDISKADFPDISAFLS